MSYIVTRLCRDCVDTGCVAVCPVDCIYEYTGSDKDTYPNQLYINPDECIDCGACEPECPWEAIFEDEQVPDVSPIWAQAAAAADTGPLTIAQLKAALTQRGVKFKQRDRKHVLRAALDAALSVPDGAPPESPPWLQPENAANLDARTEEFTASR